MTNLAGRVLAYAYGSEAQAVALLDNLISGLARERAQAAALQLELKSSRAQTVADALDAAAPRGPAAPCWIGPDRHTYVAQLAELRQWADTILRTQYGGYELRDCWPSHIHAIWELSTLAAAWHQTYGGNRPDLARALEFYDRWLPGTMRRIASITRTCVPDCATRRRPW
jgi:hypothetical protein